MVPVVCQVPVRHCATYPCGVYSTSVGRLSAGTANVIQPRTHWPAGTWCALTGYRGCGNTSSILVVASTIELSAYRSDQVSQSTVTVAVTPERVQTWTSAEPQV